MTKKSLHNKKHDSLPKLADSLVSGIKKILHEAKTEEDLRIGFEKLLEQIRTELNLKSTPKYEKSVYNGRSDAVHGQVIIEYEPPNHFHQNGFRSYQHSRILGQPNTHPHIF